MVLTHTQFSKVAAIAENCKDFDDDWCGAATDEVSSYLNRGGIQHIIYAPSFGSWGGVKIDASHTYIVLEDGTIIDSTVRQFIESRYATAEQKRVAGGYPHKARAPTVAVIPATDPFIDRMEYESHTTGYGWNALPRWHRRHRQREGEIMSFDSSKDKILAVRIEQFGNTNLEMKLVSYKGGDPKIQISRFAYPREGSVERSYRRTGRMTIEESRWAASTISELLGERVDEQAEASDDGTESSLSEAMSQVVRKDESSGEETASEAE